MAPNISVAQTPEEFRRQFVPRDPTRFAGTSGMLGAENELWVVKGGSVPNVDGHFFITGMTRNGGVELLPGMFVSQAHALVEASRVPVNDIPTVVTEFSNCQVEINTGAFISTSHLLDDIEEMTRRLRAFVKERFGFDLIASGLAPDGVPKVCSPCDARYRSFADSRPLHVTNAMYRVAAFHVHVACEREEELFARYNALVRAMRNLRPLGDFTQGQRYRLFETALYPAANPPELRGWDDAFAYYRSLGWLSDPKQHWGWVRLSSAREKANGEPVKPMTAEFRIWDATTDLCAISRMLEAIKAVVT